MKMFFSYYLFYCFHGVCGFFFTVEPPFNEDFVISKFSSIHINVTLVGLKNIVCCTDYFVM